MNLSYQFHHVEPYGRKGAHQKGSTKRKSSMFDIRDEMIRASHACAHVTNPQPPNLLFGVPPSVAFDLAAARAAQAVDKVGRRLRPEALVVLVGVATWPELTVHLQQDAEARDRYLRWRGATVAWLQLQWGDRLVTVVEHMDELRPHVHYIVVPERANKLTRARFLANPISLAADFLNTLRQKRPLMKPLQTAAATDSATMSSIPATLPITPA